MDEKLQNYYDGLAQIRLRFSRKIGFKAMIKHLGWLQDFTAENIENKNEIENVFMASMCLDNWVLLFELDRDKMITIQWRGEENEQ